MAAKQTPARADLKKTKAQLIEELEILRREQKVFRASPISDRQPPSSPQPLEILEVADDAIISMDEEFRIRIFNKGAEKAFGYTFAEVFEQPIDMLLPEDVRKIHGQHVENFGRGRENSRLMGQTTEVFGLRKSGERFPAEASISKGDVEGKKFFTVILRDISERKRAEEELRESEEGFRSVLENLPDAVYLKDLDGFFTMVNPEYARRRGLPGEKIIGKTVFDIAPRVYAEASAEHEREVLESGTVIRREHESLTADGTVITVMQTKFPVRDGEGNIVGVGTIATDITEHQRAEEELQISQRLMRTVFDTVPAGITVRDSEGRYILVNSTMAARYGLPADEIVGRMPGEMGLPAEQDKEFKRNTLEVFKSGRTIVSPEEFVKLPNEEGGWRQVIRAPLCDEQGEIIGVVGVGIDITERKRAEEDLNKSQRLLQTVFDAIPSRMTVKNKDGRIIMVNKAAAATMEISPEEFLQQPSLYPALSARDAAEFKQIDEQLLRDGKPVIMDRFIKWSDGKEGWYHLIRVPYKDSAGNIEGMVSINEDISDRIRSEQELRTSQRLLQTVFDTIPMGVHVKDLSGKYLMANRWTADLYGCSPEEMKGKTIKQLGVGTREYQQTVKDNDRRVFESGESMEEGPTVMTLASGKTIWRHTIKVPLRDQAGSLIGLVGILEDMTSRVEAEEALRTNEERLQMLLDYSPWGIVLKDMEGRFLMVNKHFADWSGHDGADLLGKTSHDLYPADLADKVVAQDREVAEAGIPTDQTYEIPNGGGTIRTMLNTKFPVFDRNNNVIGVGGIVTDITELRQAEEKLQENQRLLRTVIDTIPHWVFAKDADSRYLLVNQAMATSLGVTPESMTGQKTQEFRESQGLRIGTDEELASLVEMDQQVMETGKFVEEEISLTGPGREQRIHHIIKMPLLDESGAPVGVVGMSENITERVEMEQQLRESQKMEAVGQLAGGIAHDFNNLLQVIINYAQFARNNLEETEKLPGWLDNVIKAGDRAAGLTRQLLAFGRKTVLQREAVDLNELVTELVKIMGRVIEEDIEMTFNPGGNLNLALADKGMIEQIILNLCVNARDAMPDGGRLVFETSNRHADEKFCESIGLGQPGDYVMISVSDDGIGMSQEIREHIFEPFYTTKEVGKGTGLGLAMVHGIVQQHDGAIEVLSEPGHGTTFNIYLPMVDSPETSEGVSVVGDSPGGSETILVAEDEKDVLDLLTLALENQGYRVLTAKDGEDAISVFEANADQIDLVILDMVMPKMRGRQVYERIRESGSDVPVLFSTGYALDSSDAEYVAGKGLLTIQKPYAPEILYTTVRKVLDEQ